MKENAKKRQLWKGEETTEHLGVRAAPNTDLVFPSPPPPRNAWDNIAEATARVATLPGGSEIRERVTAICVATRYRWALPFVEAPPQDLVEKTLQVVLRTSCTWWSKERFWAERISLHPRYGTAIQAIQAAGRILEHDSPLLRECVRHHASILRLKVLPWMPLSTGVWLWPVDEQRYDKRAVRVLKKICICDDESKEHAFEASSDEGAHALRICARALLLSTNGVRERQSRKPRHDEEGLDEVDIERSLFEQNLRNL